MLPELVRQDRVERDRESARLSSERNKLAGMLAAANARYAGPEVIEPALLPLDATAQHKRRGIVEAGPASDRVARTDLAKVLNVHDDHRLDQHVARARETVRQDDELEHKRPAQKLAPHRRGERPLSKHDTPRTNIHHESRVMVAAIVNSRGGAVIQSYLLKLRAVFSGQPLAALRNAALVPMLGGYRYTYADDGARRRIALGLMMLCCGKWTSQRQAFGSSSTRRGLVITGISVDRLLRLAKPIGRKPYCRHTFGRRTSGDLGDMALFERWGFAIRKRLPAQLCRSFEVGPSGYAKNRYWIGCVVSQRNVARDQRNRPMSALAAVLGGVALDPGAHVAGWDWATEIPTYAPKRAGPEPPF
jgi:hypothetical protein